MKRLVLACCFVAGPVLASDDFRIDPATANQDAFHSVSKDLIDAFSYKALEPAEATGITGFGVGAYGSVLSVGSKQAWKTVTGNNISHIETAGVSVQKGLPFGFDVGAFYSYVPQADASIYGAEVRYAILEGGVVSPAVAIRGSYTGSTGFDDFKTSTYGVDVAVSKGFAFVTPYAGVGYVRGTVDPSNDIALGKEKIDQARFFAGLRVSALLFEITPEYEHIGSNDLFNLRLGLSF